MTMLDVLRKRLPDGLTISAAKETNSAFKVTFTYGGESDTVDVPKVCGPGQQNRLADTVIASTMAGFAIQRGDTAAAGKWIGNTKGHK